MVLNEDANDAQYVIRSHSDKEIKVNNVSYESSLIISANQLKENWPPQHINAITAEDLLMLSAFKPEIILLGTGKKSKILPADVLAPLLNQQYNVECMSTAAACRTYAVLSSEGRHVVAGLIIENGEKND